jgi:murein DD-endopeptidase MepM/ murein hydrolase activator NlpD
MDPISLPPLPKPGLMLDSQVKAIERMDAEHGRAMAAQELQVALFSQLIEAMRRTLPENSLLPRSPARDVLDGLFDRELASTLAARDPLGLVAHFGGGDPGEASATVRPAAAVPAIERHDVVPPVVGRLSSPYGPRRDPVSGERYMHHGVDLAAPAGTPIHAVAAGEVVESGWAGTAGQRVVVEHAQGYRTVYAHARRSLVGRGDAVVAGQAIATVGSSGRSTGPHLHFEVHRNGVPLDPASAMLTADAIRRAVAPGSI